VIAATTNTTDYKEVLRGLKHTLEESMRQFSGLLEDVDKLLEFEAPHILLEFDLHPCRACIGYSEAEPMKRHPNCEDCPQLIDREAWEADKHPYNDGIEVGR